MKETDKTVMVIAGGTWQVPLIKKVKAMGYKVLNSNLYEDSPGFAFSDYTAVADVKDKEKNLEIAEKYKVNAVLTDQSDIAVPTVAYVAEKLGCYTFGEEMAALFTNKFKMRKFCQEKGFPIPEYRLCYTIEDAKEFLRELKKTIVIKPLDSQSSRGVFTIHTEEELEQYFSISESYSNQGKGVLAERYIVGTEFTIDGIMNKGGHHSLAISQKSHFAYNPNIASKLFFSYDNENFDYDRLRRQNNELVERTGLKFGLTHGEYKYENGKFYLIEIAARGGGTKIASDIVPFLSGIDTYELLVKNALGESAEVDYSVIEKNKKRCAVLEFLDVESNGKKIKNISGLEQIREIKEVREIQLEFKIGDIVEKAQDDRSRAGFFIVCGETREKTQDVCNQIKKILDIEFE